MSLYNNVSENLKKATSIRTGIGKTISAVADSAVERLGQYGRTELGQAIVNGAQGVATSAATSLVNKYIPTSAQHLIDVAANAGRAALQGDFQSAGMGVLKSGVLGKLFPGASGIFSQAAFWGVSTPLFGGITPLKAKELYEEIRGENLAKRNLWLLEITSNLKSGAFNIPSRFNVFATGLEYSPFITEGDKAQVGAAKVDLVSGCGPVELSITTMDDQAGSLKRWFALHHAAATSSDGTVGEPGKYAIRIKIVHSFLEENSEAYTDVGLFRTENLSASLSRREDDIEELQMSFSQLDTFMRA